MFSSLGFVTRGSGYRYTLLGAKTPPPTCIPRRRNCLLLSGLVIVACACIAVLTYVDFETFSMWPPIRQTPSLRDLPPLYSNYHTRELQLHQQQWNRTEPEEHEKYFYVSGSHTDGGWGFIFHEHLLNAYLAYRQGRTFVFPNYTRKDDRSLYTHSFGHTASLEIPYTALIRGPMVGEPWGPGYEHVPLAVTKTYFEHVCPSKRKLFTYDVGRTIKYTSNVETVIGAWSWWTSRVKSPCVQAELGPIFGYMNTFDIPGNVASIWPDLISTPLLTRFAWSSLIELAFDTNRELFLPRPSLASTPYLSSLPYNTSAPSTVTTTAARYPPIPGLMTIHIPKANYADHCTFLASVGHPFVSVNAFPSLPDATIGNYTDVTEPRIGPTPSQVRAHRRRCYPSIPAIVAKVLATRATAAGLGVRRLHILTDGGPAYVARLKRALWDAAEWDSVSSTEDLALSWEQMFVLEGLEMLVAQRAQVFIGNGFSMLTANMVIMRLANNHSNDTTRFW